MQTGFCWDTESQNTHGVRAMRVEQAEFGPIQDIRDARGSWAAALLGAAAGGFVPIESFAVMHRAVLELQHKVLIAACLTYSSLSVWHWMKNALGQAWKAACWVVLLEGGMLFAEIPWLQWVALGFLVFINATHSASLLARRDEVDKRRRATGVPSANLANAHCGSQNSAEPEARDVYIAGPQLLSQPLEEVDSETEALYQRALKLVTSTKTCTVSSLKRELNVGHRRAVWLAERLERERVVGPPETSGRRLILAEANNA